MTIIEFYDKAAIENIAGALICKPDNVIFVGNSDGAMKKSIAVYADVLKKRDINTNLSYRAVNKNNLQGIISVLTQIVSQNEDCVFDLTGGDELYLVAVGTVMERFSGKIQCHRFNFNNGKLIDCDSDNKICASDVLDITVDEFVSLYNGTVVRDSTSALYSDNWNMDGEFLDDVVKMWSICKMNARLWNSHACTLGTVCELSLGSEGLFFEFEECYAKRLQGSWGKICL